MSGKVTERDWDRRLMWQLTETQMRKWMTYEGWWDRIHNRNECCGSTVNSWFAIAGLQSSFKRLITSDLCRRNCVWVRDSNMAWQGGGIAAVWILEGYADTAVYSYYTSQLTGVDKKTNQSSERRGGELVRGKLMREAEWIDLKKNKVSIGYTIAALA